MEDNITLEFLTGLQRELERRVAAIAGTVPVVTIDSEATDFREPGPWRRDLVRQLHRVERDFR